MGGFGSSRWGLHRKATTVEESRVLDLGALARKGAFRPWIKGSYGWPRGDAVDFNIVPEDPTYLDRLVLELVYVCRRTQEEIILPVGLEPAPMRFGGVRWWGRCPLTRKGTACGRRIGKLYLPPGGRYFGCRECHGLTYRKRQEHDSRVDYLRGHPEKLAAIFANFEENILNGRAILAIKASSPL